MYHRKKEKKEKEQNEAKYEAWLDSFQIDIQNQKKTNGQRYNVVVEEKLRQVTPPYSGMGRIQR